MSDAFDPAFQRPSFSHLPEPCPACDGLPPLCGICATASTPGPVRLSLVGSDGQSAAPSPAPEPFITSRRAA